MNVEVVHHLAKNRKGVLESLMGSLVAFLGFLAFAVLVQAQDQSGFLSIDCGIPEHEAYTDEMTGISYVSDSRFIDTGISMPISSEFQKSGLPRQLARVRSFPEGKRNCFTLTPPVGGRGSKYLIRARFMYGNYDGKNISPGFDLHLGVSLWDSVKPSKGYFVKDSEIIHVLTSDNINTCLVETGQGTPFISALELRLLNSSIYVPASGSLLLYNNRWDLASEPNLQDVRYKDDPYDRMWVPLNDPKWGTLNMSQPTAGWRPNDFQPPPKVMQTAITTLNNISSLILQWTPSDPSSQLYLYMHFAEIKKLEKSQLREFNIYINGDFWFGPISLAFLEEHTVHCSKPLEKREYWITLNRTENSTHPPIMNAFEVYEAKQISPTQTEQDEVDAILSIKSKYGLERNWQGDPCAPEAYVWDGLNCSYADTYTPRIISLNLSRSGLTGEVPPSISNLSMIHSLDMSHNSLTGRVPKFLSEMESLRILNLEGNNFTGPLPAVLIEKAKQGSLVLSVDETPCLSLSCEKVNYNSKDKKSNKKLGVPLVASIVAAFVVLCSFGIFWFFRSKNQTETGHLNKKSSREYESLESKKLQFTYAEILSITNNLETVVGRGGFGTVYHGYVDQDIEVAVKMLAPSSVQGYQQFRNEAKLLMKVHHRNLTSLVGYCNEGTFLGLVYEYMANGNLAEHLFDSSVNVLPWGRRLQIALDAAQGLDYLHHGCRPPIIHRDVKCTNILLNKELQAKLSDFGMCRIFPTEFSSQVSTGVVGTPGYLDPQYYATFWLNEKSDVYSFGVVLLEISTGRPAIGRDHEKTHISRWVSCLLENGDIREIVDPRLQGDIDINSAWKTVELAMRCVSAHSSERPAMDTVVVELQECLALESARKRGQYHETGLIDPHEAILPSGELVPLPR